MSRIIADWIMVLLSCPARPQSWNLPIEKVKEEAGR